MRLWSRLHHSKCNLIRQFHERYVQALSMPIIQIKNEIRAAEPQRTPLDRTKTFFCGNALNISMMPEKIQPIRPVMSITDQRSLDIKYYFPINFERSVCRRSFQTISTASRTIDPDIFELPAWRSIKIIGISVMRKPFSMQR